MKQTYSLIELLITIAIIAILTSRLISVVNLGVKKQKAIACTDNGKDIMAATLQYSGDNGGKVPDLHLPGVAHISDRKTG